MNTRTLELPLAAAAVALMLAACGGSGEPGADPAATPPVEQPMPAPGEAAPEAGAETAPATNGPTAWVCGDTTVEVTYDKLGNALTLTHAGGTLTLPGQVSASGARYADDTGNEFWDAGDEATLTLAGQEERSCSKG